MIEINQSIRDDVVYKFAFQVEKEEDVAIITLTGKDLKKLVSLLNLSIGNIPQAVRAQELLRTMEDILGGEKGLNSENTQGFFDEEKE